MTHPNEVHSKTILGFWIYLLTDFMMFGALFATYAVLVKGPLGRDLFSLPFTLVQTLILLVSSFTFGLSERMVKGKWVLWGFTFFLGVLFLGMEGRELSSLVKRGFDWQTNAFLSIFFTLLGTHALHVIFGLLWMVVLLVPVGLFGLTEESVRKLTCLRMFWQFVNVVWIFIFSIVYLLGVA